MRTSLKAMLCVVAALLLGGGQALALPITDTWADPSGDILLDLSNSDQPIPGVRSSYGYQHDITDDGFSVGDTISSATLYVSVRDAGGSEVYRYEIGLAPLQTTIFSNVPNERIDEILLGALSLADLQLDGIIDVVIRITDDSNNQQGLYFVNSSLVAQVNSVSQGTEVPEPGTLAILAFGLAALTCRFRRPRFSK
jgi:hypothetical protein